MRAYITREPWKDVYELRLATDWDRDTMAATGVLNGDIVWERIERGGIMPVFLNLSPETLQAIGNAAFDTVPPASDATVTHLADTREIRDRLLTIVERQL